MPKLKHRIIYDGDGNPMPVGSKVLVNGKHEEIIYLDDNGEISISNTYMEDIESVEMIPDDRFGELEDSLVERES